jgi:hypothetical protein
MMARVCSWLAELLSQTLDPLERDAALGDLAESGGASARALRDIFGLVARRQAAPWKPPWPWFALFAIVLPFGAFLTMVSRLTTFSSSVTIWLYAGNWDWALLGDAAYRHDLAKYGAEVLLSYLTLACWAWTTGFLLANLSRGAVIVNGIALCVVLLPGLFLGIPLNRGDPNSAVFELTFYRVMLLPIIHTALVLVPSVGGMRMGFNAGGHWGLAAASTLTIVTGLAAIALHNQLAWWLLLHIGFYWPIAYLTTAAIRRRLRRSAS